MAFIKKLANFITDTKNYNLVEDSLIVIFPNKRAALTLRNELVKCIGKNIWLPQILSIEEAMSLWSGLKLVDNVDVIYKLIEIMNKKIDISTRKNLFALASQLVKDFDEIDQYDVDAKKIFEYLKEVKETEKWTPGSDENLTETESAYLRFFNSLYFYYTQLRERLLDDNSAYYGLMTRKLHDLLKTDGELEKVVGDNKIIFAGFNAMTRTEEDIIVRLVESGKAKLFWDLDKYYYEDEMQEAGLFARNFVSEHGSLNPEKNNGTNNADDFNIIENYFHIGEEQPSKEKKIINIIGVAGNTIQANALQIKLNEELNNKDSLKNEVIVLSDETLLIPVINSIPENYKDINVTMGYPYSETFINQFIQLLFPFQNNLGNKEEAIYFWSLKRLLETEMIKVIFTNDELDSLTKCMDIFLNQSAYYLTIKDIEKYLNQDNVLTFLKEITKKWQSSFDCISSITSILQFIYNSAKATNNTFVINQISIAVKIFNKIERLIKKYDSLIQICDIEVLYKQTASEMSIKFKNKDSENNIESSLQIMGLLETRNLDFDTIHILSVNEDILPQSKTPNSLIPFDLRLEYKLPVYTKKQAVYAYHFYRLIQNAKNVNIYYNTLPDDVGGGEPSRFILQLINEIPRKTKGITINQISYKLPSPVNDNIVNIDVKKTPEILEKVKKKLHNEKYNEELKCYEKYGLSPTSISCYLNCPLQFYIRYIEKIEDDTPKENLQYNIIGKIIHSTFEHLYLKFGKSIIDKDCYDLIVKQDKELDKDHKGSFSMALDDNNFANGLPDSGFNYLAQIKIKELIENFIDNEKKFFIQGNKLTIKGLEEKLVYEFDIDEDTKVYLTGFADRIDQVVDKIRILDYKSGRVENSDVKITSKTDTAKNIKTKALQLCIYKFLYAKNHPDISINNIEPGIFGLLNANNPYYPLIIESENFKNDFMGNCEDMFINIFKEILNPEIPFKQTEDENDCKYCDYLNICKRNPPTW